MKYFYSMLVGLLLMLPSFLFAQGDEFTKYEMSFKNFLTCELTRTGAINHFEGKAFKITMIDLFSIQRESGMVILTGAVRCAVEGRYFVLYAALGVEAILDKEKVSYYTIRKKDFSILVTGLIRFPYKERCPWSRYWVDTD